MIVRALVQDDARQAATARDVLSQDFMLLGSVILEVEWVLRSRYGWPRERIAEAFAEIADLPSLQDAPASFNWIVARYRAGADFADMIHVAVASGATRFVTFDRRVGGAVGPHTPVPIETLG